MTEYKHTFLFTVQNGGYTLNQNADVFYPVINRKIRITLFGWNNFNNYLSAQCGMRKKTNKYVVIKLNNGKTTIDKKIFRIVSPRNSPLPKVSIEKEGRNLILTIDTVDSLYLLVKRNYMLEYL